MIWRVLKENREIRVNDEGLVQQLIGGQVWVDVPQQTNNRGYPYVRIRLDGYRRSVATHRLMMFAFCKQDWKSLKLQVHHIDGNKSNNNLNNLQFLTQKQHQLWHSETSKISCGTPSMSTGNLLGLYKLATSDEFSQRKLAKMFNVSSTFVSALRNGKTYDAIISYYLK